MEKKLLTIGEATKQFSIGKNRLYEICNKYGRGDARIQVGRKQIKVEAFITKVGKKNLILPDEFMAFIKISAEAQLPL